MNAQPINEDKLEQFVHQAFGDLSVAASGVMVSLGHRLGLYQAMMGAGPLTADALADKTGCAPRYVREWLNSQVASDYVDYDGDTETYTLGMEQAMVLANADSPVFMAPAWEVDAAMWADLDKAVEVFRSGEGVPWGAHDKRLYCGTAAFFRNGYRQNLVPNWLPALHGVVDKLERGGRVADVGCGYGHSTVLMAEAFPNSTFHGYDSHAASIEAARKIAADAGLSEHARFEIAQAKDYPDERFDLVCYFDCLHDMGDPLGAARHAHDCLDDDGSVLLVEPIAGDRVEDNINPVGRMFYAASTTLCCAHSLSEDGDQAAALGSQAGEKRLREIFLNAGFEHFRRATETPFNMILEARKSA